MGTTYCNLNYHFVFSTKERRPFLGPTVRQALFNYMSGIITAEGGLLFEAGGIADHVHLLVRLHPTQTISDVMRVIKGKSSFWIHENYPNLHAFAWQEGYAAFSVSKSQVEGVRDSIRRQEEHHAKRDFKSELLEMLVRHEIEYDDRYVFG